jgi:hypothetical protein
MRILGSKKPSRRALGAVVGMAFAALATLAAGEHAAWAQACCAGASGLTPGWLTNHESALVGAQTRLLATHGTYPTSGAFYTALPERDTRVETSLFGSLRLLPRAQVSVLAPLVTTRRRSGDVVEERVAPGDVTVVSRYDFVRAGESRIPGLALLAGAQLPTGTPPDKGDGLLAANVTGTGAWELDAGGSVEQVLGHVVLHATVLAGYRFPHAVLGVPQHLGLHTLYLVAGGWVFDDDVSILATITHIGEGDATIAGLPAPGTGYRTTQAALLVIVPLTDTLRIRTSVFSDVPPFGDNRPAMGGTAISIAKSWL